MGKLYDVLKWGFRLVLPRMTTEWEEPLLDEPSVFVCNHIGAMGPIRMCASFPLSEKMQLWSNEAVMNARLCPDYVRHDFWWDEQSVLAPLYNVTLPYLAAAVMPPVLKSAPTIPVYHDARIMTTMRQSLKALQGGSHLVIFPEKPDGFASYAEEINTGWLNLCVMYRKMTGKDLRLYPVHIDTKNHVFRVARPVTVDPSIPLADQEPELNRILGAGLRGEKIA